jgi:hypothetical protein
MYSYLSNLCIQYYSNLYHNFLAFIDHFLANASYTTPYGETEQSFNPLPGLSHCSVSLSPIHARWIARLGSVSKRLVYFSRLRNLLETLSDYP